MGSSSLVTVVLDKWQLNIPEVFGQLPMMALSGAVCALPKDSQPPCSLSRSQEFVEAKVDIYSTREIESNTVPPP